MRLAVGAGIGGGTTTPIIVAVRTSNRTSRSLRGTSARLAEHRLCAASRRSLYEKIGWLKTSVCSASTRNIAARGSSRRVFYPVTQRLVSVRRITISNINNTAWPTLHCHYHRLAHILRILAPPYKR
ncbi:hypothetical protein U1Q18_051550 [Sarracenia purpurea var. burkii]